MGGKRNSVDGSECYICLARCNRGDMAPGVLGTVGNCAISDAALVEETGDDSSIGGHSWCADICFLLMFHVCQSFLAHSAVRVGLVRFTLVLTES